MKERGENDHINRLIQLSFEGQLAEAEIAKLREWLSSHPAELDRYLEHCEMESWLRDPAWRGAPAEGKVIPLSDSTPPAVSEWSPPFQPKAKRWLLGIAAGLAIFAATGLILQWNSRDPKAERGVVRILRVEGAGSVNVDAELSRGMELHAGDRVSMEEGLIEMAFRDTGVHVIATAPLSLTTDSVDQLSLADGEVKLVVPPQGIGFVVETPDRKITDLGTSFVVTSRPNDSKVLVLDGQITVSNRDGSEERLMNEGELANFNLEGRMQVQSHKPSGVPELALRLLQPSPSSLSGISFGFEPSSDLARRTLDRDEIGSRVMPLIRSGFQDRSCLSGLKHGAPLRFSGIAGTYNGFPARAALEPYHEDYGWLAWYRGRVTPPQSGRYRFWGYADNQLLVAVEGEPIFEGSRYDSVFRRELEVPRQNHPAFPCLNSVSGFASGPWFDLDTEDPVQIDLLFGETSGKYTSALLLIEREGAEYETTFWGQPKWSLFLTEVPSKAEMKELHRLRRHMEEKLIGSFSLSEDSIWKVAL